MKYTYFSFCLALYQGKNLATWTKNDVHCWIQSLGENYTIYSERFKKESVDGYHLFNFFNIYTLIKFGITNEEHQQKILDGIQQLKKVHPILIETLKSSLLFCLS